MAPKSAHVLIPRTCGSVTCHGKRHFADVFSLRSWGREIILGYSGESSVIRRGLMRREHKNQSQRRRGDDGSRGQKERGRSEDAEGPRSQQMHVASRNQERKAKTRFSPKTSRGTSPAHTFILAQGNSFQTTYLQTMG